MGASERADKEADSSTCALQAILTCMLDFEPLKDPKVLQCGHTFCRGCLEKLAAMRRDDVSGQLSCPLCSKMTPIPNGDIRELPDNFTVIQLRDMGKTVVKELQLYEGKEKTVSCDSCSSQPGKVQTEARYFCYKCSEHYCDECCKKHGSSFTDHSEVVDLQSTVKNMLQVVCIKHNKHMKFYCLQCSQALCTVCRLHDHPEDHNLCIVDIADKDTIIEKRANIRGLRPVVTENLNEATRRSQLLQNVRKTLYDSYAKMDSELLQSFEKIRLALFQQLDMWYQQLEGERVQRRTNFEKQLDITQEDLNFHVSSCQSLDGFLEHILKEDTQFQPLSLYSDLSARMSTLDKFMPEIEHISAMPVAVFVQNDKCLQSLDQPGWWEEDIMEVSFQGGKLAVTPNPNRSAFAGTPSPKPGAFGVTPSPKPRSKDTFFGDDFLVPLPYSSTPKAGQEAGQAVGRIHSGRADEFLSSLPPPEPLSRSVSEVQMYSDDEDDFDRGSNGRTSWKAPGDKKSSKFRFRRKRALKNENRAMSAMTINSPAEGGNEKIPGRARHVSGPSKPSFLTSFLRRSMGKSKKEKAKEEKKPCELMRKSSGRLLPVDGYSMLWHRSGEIGRGTSVANTHSIRFLTGACYGDDNCWYLADNMSAKLMSYDAETASKKGIFSVAKGSFKPWSVAVAGHSENNSLHVHCTDVENRCVQVFMEDNSDGGTTLNYQWGQGEMVNPSGICFLPSADRVVVSDVSSTAPTLLIADMNGSIISRITSMYGGGDAQLKHPWYVTSDDHGRIYVSDRDNHAVKVFDENGQFLTRFKHKIGSPAGIAVDPMGYILVADRSGNHNIAMFTADGQFVSNLKTKDEISWPQALSCDPYNTVVVTEYLENSLTTLKCFGKA